MLIKFILQLLHRLSWQDSGTLLNTSMRTTSCIPLGPMSCYGIQDLRFDVWGLHFGIQDRDSWDSAVVSGSNVDLCLDYEGWCGALGRMDEWTHE